MPRYDLCLAWNWEYDADFVHLIEVAWAARGVSLLTVAPDSLDQVLAGLENKEVFFSTLFDRASESDPRFQPLVAWAIRHRSFCLNPQKRTLWSGDKATMHLEFISRGLYTPYTIILSPFTKRSSIPPSDLQLLGGSFAIMGDANSPAVVGQNLLSARFGIEGSPTLLLITGNQQEVLRRAENTNVSRIPVDDREQLRLAKRLGFANTADFLRNYRHTTRKIRELYTELLPEN